ncbi:hypothetical protein H0W80_03325 [Candidatus Saccharibacteria bacterium]|nr:hypothetical protein [Candidatus Saccharibacteria bacterium]
MTKLSAAAVKEVLEVDMIGTYKYKCISTLDSIALNAMTAMTPHADETLYFRVGVKAIQNYLAARPGFLEIEDRTQHTSVAPAPS